MGLVPSSYTGSEPHSLGQYGIASGCLALLGSKIGDAALSRPFGAAATLPWVRGKSPLYLIVVWWQL